MTATATSNLPITPLPVVLVWLINGTFLKIVGAGSATVTASQNGDSQPGLAAPTVDKNVTVTKANQAIVRNDNNATLLNRPRTLGTSNSLRQSSRSKQEPPLIPVLLLATAVQIVMWYR